MNFVCFTERNNRSVIHGMMKCRPRQYQAVHDYDVYAGGHLRFEMTQHSAGSGAVQVQLVALSAKKRRDHKGLPIHVEPDMS